MAGRKKARVTLTAIQDTKGMLKCGLKGQRVRYNDDEYSDDDKIIS